MSDVLDHALRGEPAETAVNPSTALARGIDQWLDWQCRMVSGVLRGAVFLSPTGDVDRLEQVGLWPARSVSSQSLRAIAAKAVESGDNQTHKETDDNDGEVCDYVAYPLLTEDAAVGAVALSMTIRSESQRQAVLQLMQWGTVWLEQILERGGAEEISDSTPVLEALKGLADGQPLAVGTHQLCNSLAEQTGASLVALGIKQGLQVRLASLSHQVRFDRRARGISQIEFAMEECADHGEPMMLPQTAGDGKVASQAHVQLVAAHAGEAVCSVPVRVGGETVAVLTLLRDSARPFDVASLRHLAMVADRIAPLLKLKELGEQSFWQGLRQVLVRPFQRLFGRGRLRVKLVAMTLLVLGVLSAAVDVDHRISATATVEGSLQQAVVAPFAGYLSEVHARAGDRVKAGQLLARLDERELLLEQEKLSGERDKHRREHQEALAQRERARVTMLAARVDQVQAQLDLVAEQLQRTRLVAPFDGMLVSGDWKRALGAPVERGQLLFEIVPDENFRVILQVDEHDVAYLQPGQTGSLRLAGMPEQGIDIEVERIHPVASAAEGGNHFRVEGRLPDGGEGLRPGMQGVSKVLVGRGSAASVWTAPLRQRLALWAWESGL